MPPTTIKQLLLQTKQKIDPLDAELLLAQTIGKSRERVLTHPESKIIKSKVIKFIKLVKQRERGVPIAYLTGHKEFFGLDFEVNKDVLIPRPDTEILVESVLKEFQNSKFKIQNSLLIDVGAGSGCIPISIIKTLNRKNIKTIAIDISKQALNVARRNAKKHDVKIKFIQGDLLSPILKSSILNLKSSIIITANLPYLTAKQFKSSPSIQHEPRLALVTNKRGMALYEKLLKQIAKLLTLWTLMTLWTFIEIDPSQSKSITLLIKSILPGAKIEIKKDLTGLDRVVMIGSTY